MKIDIDGVIWENVKDFSISSDGRINVWGFLSLTDRPWTRYNQQHYSVLVYEQGGLEFQFRTFVKGNVSIIPKEEECVRDVIQSKDIYIMREGHNISGGFDNIEKLRIAFDHNPMYSPSINGSVEFEMNQPHVSSKVGLNIQYDSFFENPDYNFFADPKVHYIRIMHKVQGQSMKEIMAFREVNWGTEGPFLNIRASS